MAEKEKSIEKRNIFSSIFLFVKQVIEEMKVVVYPTRKETTTYVIVVLVFVTVVMLFITLVDFVVGSLVSMTFGA
jgi:preprotein translocase subunit SecE